MASNPSTRSTNGSKEPSRTNVADLVWKSAELLTGAFKPAEYRKAVLPLFVLRRLDCLLEPTKDAVLAKHKEIKAKNYDPKMFMETVTGYPFWNVSRFTMKKLLEAPEGIRDNLEDMINGFSPNVRRIFEKFGFMQTVDKLQEKGRLYLVVQNFANTAMDLKSLSGHDMGVAFEELLRKFNDVAPADEQYTPRDVIHLMVNILFDGEDEALSVPGIIRTMYDPASGTGGMLSEGEEKFRTFNSNARLRLFGQELEDETYAICMSDMLIRGQDPADIALGDTLGDDRHPDKRFDYMLSNPPYGREWKPSEEAVTRERRRGAAGRFGPGLPRISDGQMLFMLHLLSKMRPVIDGEGGSRIGVVHNGSPLFTGDAGSGESEIRRYILEHDYLDAIVALPADMFYNTNIATYLWFTSNRKPPERKNKVLLVDASGMGFLMKKNQGKKRLELSQDCQERITKAYHDFADLSWQDGAATGGRQRGLKAKVFDTGHFFYRKVTIERPLRMRFEFGLAGASTTVYESPLSRTVPGNKVAEGFDLLADLWSTFKKMPTADVDELKAAVGLLRANDPSAVWTSADDFREALQRASRQVGAASKAKVKPLSSKQLETARKLFGFRDKGAAPVTNEKGSILPDPDLRDAEYIPFLALGGDVTAGIATYFDAEVKPHWPDAWVNVDVNDDRDGQVGVVGCEINFNREFYVYAAPRSREQIRHDIEAMEKRFMEMLREVAK